VARIARSAALLGWAAAGGLYASAEARADVTVAQPADGWQLYTNGRVNAFVSYASGDGRPRDTYDPQTMEQVRQITGGGLDAFAERQPIGPGQLLTQGTIEGLRVRSGFVGNVVGLGARRQLTDSTRVTLYLSLWSFVESVAHRKYFPVYPDMREGYLKLEGAWGSLLAGRSGVLFSRGATEIAFFYGHGYGLGYPGDLDESGPAVGHIGFGVLANGFGAGVAYATPVLAGLQLTVGYYDPSNLAGSSFERTKLGRPEAELTYEVALGARGRMKLFANGAYQQVYKTDDPRSDSVYGAGYGGRLELGSVRLGVAGHWGKGLGLSYALEPSEATYSRFPPGGVSQLRVFDGLYVQGQLVLGRVDLAAGWGITRVHQLDIDRDGLPGQPAISLIKTQTGLSASVVYHLRDWLHLDLDIFRADFRWYYGEKQVVTFVNAGPTVTW
jgi:hypothetical protein